MLPDKDRTLLVEGGVTLSGGQRARLGLARYVPSRPDPSRPVPQHSFVSLLCIFPSEPRLQISHRSQLAFFFPTRYKHRLLLHSQNFLLMTRQRTLNLFLFNLFTLPIIH